MQWENHLNFHLATLLYTLVLTSVYPWFLVLSHPWFVSLYGVAQSASQGAGTGQKTHCQHYTLLQGENQLPLSQRGKVVGKWKKS